MRWMNMDIREKIVKERLFHKDIAKQMGVSQEYFCRLMASELSETNRIRILNAIEALKADADSEAELDFQAFIAKHPGTWLAVVMKYLKKAL